MVEAFVLKGLYRAEHEFHLIDNGHLTKGFEQSAYFSRILVGHSQQD
ncbi:MAG: hypothetical protein ACJAV5_001524 [Vicingaceae bacterium]|jgi:hypothetical protein